MSDPAEEVEPEGAAEDFIEQTGPSLFGDDDLFAPASPGPVPEAAPPDVELDEEASAEASADAGFDPDDPALGEPDDDGPEDADEGPDAEIPVPAFDPAPDAEAEIEERVEQEASQGQLALYRRYRPDTFDEVIGQEHVTEPLMRAIANGRVNHAYLFSGPRGCGKTTSARILARCLNCAEGPTPTPCGHCRSCRDLATGGPGSIDVIEIDAASHGGVDDARELREGVYFAPVHSRYKIYIIDEAHMVTPAGFNALLKVVEEPPAHVKFIFATTEPDKVIGTIRSRTHHYPFRLVPPKVLTGHLQRICDEEHVRVDSGVLPLVVRAGAGSVRDCLSVLDQLLGAAEEGSVGYEQAAALLGYTPDALLDEMIDAFSVGDGRGVFGTIDRVIEIGQDPRRFAEDLLTRLRDLVIIAQVPDALASGLLDVAPDLADRLGQQAARFGAGELTRAAEVIAQGLTTMRGTTAPRLYLELMCARVLVPGADAGERGTAARLDRIERRLDIVGAGELSGQGPAQAAPGAPTAQAPHRPGAGPARPGGPAPQGAGPRTPQAADPWGTTTPQGPAAPDAVHQGPAPQGPAPQGPAFQTPAPQGPGSQGPGSQGAGSQGPGSPYPAPRPQGAPPVQSPASAFQRPAPGPAQGPQGRPSPAAPPNAGGRAPAAQRPAGSPPAGTPAPAAGQPDVPGPAQVSTAQLRQLWPQVLEAVKNRRRFAWMTLSPNAQVLAVQGGRLTLAFNNPGAREAFVSHGGSETLHAALVDVLGATLEIDTVIEGQAAVDELRRGPGRPGGERPGGEGPNPSERASAGAQQPPASPAAGPTAGPAVGPVAGRPVDDPWAAQDAAPPPAEAPGADDDPWADGPATEAPSSPGSQAAAGAQSTGSTPAQSASPAADRAAGPTAAQPVDDPWATQEAAPGPLAGSGVPGSSTGSDVPATGTGAPGSPTGPGVPAPQAGQSAPESSGVPGVSSRPASSGAPGPSGTTSSPGAPATPGVSGSSAGSGAPPAQPSSAGPAPTVHHHVIAPPSPEEAYDPDSDVSMDDATVEESDRSATQLLIDELGAVLIEEIPNEPTI